MSDQANTLRNLIAGRKSAAPTGSGTCEIVAVTSGKGGVGKSNITINLCLALAKMGQKVVILDADIGTANVDILMGMDPRLHLGHVFDGSASLFQIMEKVTDNLYLLPGASGLSNVAEMPYDRRDALRTDLAKIDANFDFLFVDTSAGVSAPVINLLRAADRVLLVSTAEPTAIVDAYALCKVLFEVDSEAPVQLIANNINGEDEAAEVYGKLNVAVKHFLKRELQYLSHVVRDESLVMGVVNQRPLMLTGESSPATQNFESLASELAHTGAWSGGKGVHLLFENLLQE